jgi:protoheme IX farnesyltransferase
MTTAGVGRAAGIEGNGSGLLAPIGWLDRARAYVALTKPRIVGELLITTVPTMLVASRHLPAAGLVLLTLLGGALAAGGAHAVNMVYDRDIDAVMERTKHRPLVTGVISPGAALGFGALLEVVSFLVLWRTVNLLSAGLTLAAAAFYVVVYTMWLKRSSPQNIVIGGAAGAVPPLVGWSAVTGHVGGPALILFGIIFLWTPPHFWALALRYREDYTNAEVPMLPSTATTSAVVRRMIAYTVALVALSALLAPTAHLGPAFLALTLLLGAAFVWQVWRLRSDPGARRAMKVFGFSISYLTVLFLAMGLTAVVQHP